MQTSSTNQNDTKPMGFGKTMLASAVGFIIGSVVLSLISFIFAMIALVSAISNIDEKKPLIGSNFAVELNVTGMVSESAPNELASLFGDNTTCSIQQMLASINESATDSRVKALYLHLGNSDLSWAQSQELLEAVKDFRSRCDKPVIAYGEAFSQPEYYLATAANRIAIHPSGIIDFRGMGDCQPG